MGKSVSSDIRFAFSIVGGFAVLIIIGSYLTCTPMINKSERVTVVRVYQDDGIPRGGQRTVIRFASGRREDIPEGRFKEGEVVIASWEEGRCGSSHIVLKDAGDKPMEVGADEN